MDYQYLQFNNIWGLYNLISDLSSLGTVKLYPE